MRRTRQRPWRGVLLLMLAVNLLCLSPSGAQLSAPRKSFSPIASINSGGDIDSNARIVVSAQGNSNTNPSGDANVRDLDTGIDLAAGGWLMVYYLQPLWRIRFVGDTSLDSSGQVPRIDARGTESSRTGQLSFNIRPPGLLLSTNPQPPESSNYQIVGQEVWSVVASVMGPGNQIVPGRLTFSCWDYNTVATENSGDVVVMVVYTAPGSRPPLHSVASWPPLKWMKETVSASASYPIAPIVDTDGQKTAAAYTRLWISSTRIEDLVVGVRATYFWPIALSITLVHPSGKRIVLKQSQPLVNGDISIYPNFGTGDSSCAGGLTQLSDAGTAPISTGQDPYISSVWKPDSKLSGFNGKTSTGWWTLEVSDAEHYNMVDVTWVLSCFQLSGTVTRSAVESPDPSSGGLSTGAIIGIVCGSVGFVAMCVCILLVYRRRRKQPAVSGDGANRVAVARRAAAHPRQAVASGRGVAPIAARNARAVSPRRMKRVMVPPSFPFAPPPRERVIHSHIHDDPPPQSSSPQQGSPVVACSAAPLPDPVTSYVAVAMPTYSSPSYADLPSNAAAASSSPEGYSAVATSPLSEGIIALPPGGLLVQSELDSPPPYAPPQYGEVAQPVSASFATSPTVARVAGASFCTECGHPRDGATSKFCGSCGHAFVQR